MTISLSSKNIGSLLITDRKTFCHYEALSVCMFLRKERLSLEEARRLLKKRFFFLGILSRGKGSRNFSHFLLNNISTFVSTWIRQYLLWDTYRFLLEEASLIIEQGFSNLFALLEAVYRAEKRLGSDEMLTIGPTCAMNKAISNAVLKFSGPRSSIKRDTPAACLIQAGCPAGSKSLSRVSSATF